MAEYICSWSGGKDSTASIILCHEHGLPLDEIIYAEPMFSLAEDISADSPLQRDFICRVAKPVFESWGYKVTILHSDRDYLSVFHHVIKKAGNPAHVGKRYGFPLPGMCAIQRDCKLRPIRKYLAGLGSDVIQYVGICASEPKRLESLHREPWRVSVLEQFGYTEEMARKLCEKYGLLSPTYGFSKRGGCFFCPFAKPMEQALVKSVMPDVWNRFVELESEEGLAYSKWLSYGETLKERDGYIDRAFLL